MDLYPKYNDNSSITRSEFNSLVRNTRAQAFPGGNGFADGDTLLGQYDKSTPVPEWFDISSTVDIPAFSVFTIKQNPDNTTIPFNVQVAKIAADGWRPTLLTNGQDELIRQNGGGTCRGFARIIDWFKPIRLQTHTDTETNPLPEAGKVCGPIDTSFQVAINGHGLLCLAVSEDELHCWCVMSQPGYRWLVKPVATIPKNGEIGEVIVWYGEKGAEVESNPQVKFMACNRTSAACEIDKFAEMVAIENKLYIVPWECVASGAAPVATPATAIDSASDNFDRTIANNIGVSSPYAYTAVFGSAITDFMIRDRATPNHACRMSLDNSGVVLTAAATTTASLDCIAEIETFGLATGDDAGVILSYLDDSNNYTVYGTKVSGTQYTITITQKVAGTPTVLATSTVTLPGGSNFWVVAEINFVTGKISGYMRDELYAKSAILEAAYAPNTGYKIGFGAGLITGSYTDIDNFKVDETHLA